MTNEDRYRLARFTAPEEGAEPMPGVFVYAFVLGLTFVIVAAVAVFG